MHPDGGPLQDEVAVVWSAVSAAIESWKARSVAGGTLNPALSQALQDSLRTELRTYLGRGAAESLDAKSARGGTEPLLTRAQVLLEAFLGRDAAAPVLDEMIGDMRRRSFRVEAS